MNIKINNPNKVIIKELDKVLKDLHSAKGGIFEDYGSRSDINKAEGRIEAIKSLLEIED